MVLPATSPPEHNLRHQHDEKIGHKHDNENQSITNQIYLYNIENQIVNLIKLYEIT